MVGLAIVIDLNIRFAREFLSVSVSERVLVNEPSPQTRSFCVILASTSHVRIYLCGLRCLVSSKYANYECPSIFVIRTFMA